MRKAAHICRYLLLVFEQQPRVGWVRNARMQPGLGRKLDLKRWWTWIGAVALTILVLAWFGYNVAETWTDIRLLTSGETTSGTLLSDASGSSQTGFEATVAFTTSDGQQVETWIATSAFDAEGDVLDVRYDPADPTNVTTAGIGSIILGSLLLLFPLGFSVAGLWFVVEERPWARNP